METDKKTSRIKKNINYFESEEEDGEILSSENDDNIMSDDNNSYLNTPEGESDPEFTCEEVEGVEEEIENMEEGDSDNGSVFSSYSAYENREVSGEESASDAASENEPFDSDVDNCSDESQGNLEIDESGGGDIKIQIKKAIIITDLNISHFLF